MFFYFIGSGNNSLGHGIGINLLPIPSRIESLHGTEIVKVACMDNNSFAVTKDGQLYVWGENGPLLGNSTTVACALPVHNTCIRQEVIAVYAGYSHAGEGDMKSKLLKIYIFVIVT